MLKLLLTPNEAAHALAISRSKLYRLMREGRIESVMLGGNRRIAVDSLDRLIESLRSVPDSDEEEARDTVRKSA
jgi:excisionase family DNA binding protein